MAKEIRPDRVAIYIRWSTEDQSDNTTLVVQREACSHYVQSQGWTVRDDLILIDDGYSGGSLDRPAMTRLRKMVSEGLIDCVVVFKLDRLSRSVIDTVTLVLQEWDDLTHLKSAREPVDTTTAMGKQFFYMLVSYAEWERNVIRERMFGGKMRRAQEGRSPGMPTPYGYKKGKTPGTMVVVEPEAEVIRMVYQLAEKGTTVRQITKHLNQQGFPTRKGAPWGTSMVSKMLHNPAYTGRLVWGRRRTNPRHQKAPNEPRFRLSDPYVDQYTSNIPAIITQEQFDAVQVIMEGNIKINAGAKGSHHLLTGLIKCEKCDHFMQYNEYSRWAYYRCGWKMQQGSCDAPSIPARPLEETVLHLVRDRFGSRILSEAEATGTQEMDAHLAEVEAALRSVSETITKLENQERRVNQDYLQERISAEDRRSLLAHIIDEKALLLAKQSELQMQVQEVQVRLESIQANLNFVQDPSLWEQLPVEEQKNLLRFFISQIRAGRPSHRHLSVDITWRDEPQANVELN